MPKQDSNTKARNISLAIPILKEGVVLQHKERSTQDMLTRGGEHGYIFVTAHGRFRPAPPSAKESKRLTAGPSLTRSGNLFFLSYEEALASGLGDQEQLRALQEGNAYRSDKVIEVIGISNEDADYLDRELYGAHMYDERLRKLECWRRLQDVRLIWKAHLEQGNRRPLELRQLERSLSNELKRLFRAINELKAKNRTRTEDPALTAEADAIKAQLKKAHAEFDPYYKRPPNTPVDDQIAALGKQFRKSDANARAKEDFEPTFTSRRQALEDQRKAARKSGDKQLEEQIKAALDALEREREQAQAQLSALKKLRETINPRAALEDQYQELLKEAYRDHFGYVSTGSRQHIRDKYKENGRWFQKLRKGAPPKTHPYEGSGSLYVEFPGGLSVESLRSGANRRAQLRVSEKNPLHTRLFLTTQHRTVSVPVLYHNELPRDGIITSIRITRKHDASKCRTYRSRWDQQRLSAVFNVRSDSFSTPIRVPQLTGAIAPSFRKLENGDLRIGIFTRSDGYIAEIRMAYDTRAIYLRPLSEKRLGSPWEQIPRQRRDRPLKTRAGGIKRHRRGVYASLQYADAKNAGKVSEIRSSDGGARNAEFEVARARLLEFLRDHSKDVPQWLLDRCRGRRARAKKDKGFRGLARFRSKEGFHTLAHLFLVYYDRTSDPFVKKNPDGTTRALPLRAIQFSDRPTLAQIEELPEPRREIMRYLWGWTAVDRHNHEHEVGNRGRALRFRKNEYRRLALFLMRECTIIKIQDIDQKRGLSRESGLETTQRQQGRAVAISELKSCLSHAAAKLGGKADYINAPEAHQWAPSSTHYVCGNKVAGVSDDVMVYCEHCKVSYDRDVNAAQNTLTAPNEWIGLKRPKRREKAVVDPPANTNADTDASTVTAVPPPTARKRARQTG